jgi:hypothetical protein
MAQQSLLDVMTPQQPGGGDDAHGREVVFSRCGIERFQHRLAEGVADDDDSGNAVLFDLAPQLVGAEPRIGQNDDRSAVEQIDHHGVAARAVHQRTGRRGDARREIGADDLLMLAHRLRHDRQQWRFELVAPCLRRGPEHAFGLASGAARIEQEAVVARPLDLERLTVAAGRQRLERQVSGRNGLRDAVGFDPHPVLHRFEQRPELDNERVECVLVDKHRRGAIIDDIGDLVGDITEIDVHLQHPRLQTGGDRFHVRRMIVAQDRGAIVCGHAEILKTARQIVGACGEFGPADHSVAPYQRRPFGRHHFGHRVQYVAVVPVHLAPLLPHRNAAIALRLSCGQWRGASLLHP